MKRGQETNHIRKQEAGTQDTHDRGLTETEYKAAKYRLKPLQWPRDSIERSWIVSTLLLLPGGCGKACSTSQTTGPAQALLSAHQTACPMTSKPSTPASRPPGSTQRGGTHTLGPPNSPPSYCLISCGTQSAEEDQPPQGSSYRAGWCTHFHL